MQRRVFARAEKEREQLFKDGQAAGVFDQRGLEVAVLDIDPVEGGGGDSGRVDPAGWSVDEAGGTMTIRTGPFACFRSYKIEASR